MKTNILAVLFILATGFGACSKDDDNNNILSTTDRNFLLQAAESNFAEIGVGQLAYSKGTDSSLQVFGLQMVSDHEMAQQSLNSVALNFGIVIIDSLSPAHVTIKNTLMSLSSGYTFDTTYINSQIRDHQEAIIMYQNEINNGSSVDVKNYANKYLPIIEMHLQMADSIAENL